MAENIVPCAAVPAAVLACIGKATAVKVEATRKLGEILMATPKATGAKGIGKSAVAAIGC